MPRAIRNDIDIETLRATFSYDPDTGIISWKLARLGRHPGTRAGTVMTNGYIYIKIGGTYYLAHRIAWALAHGAWPNTQIDHRDCNPTNNRLSNLRLATRSQNQSNRSAQSNSGTGIKGVSRHARGGFWARIGHAGRQHYLGYFKTAEEAKKAYEQAAAKLHGDFART